MNKVFADFLKFRAINVDILILEDKYDISIPPIYRSFIDVFESIVGDIVRLDSGEFDTLSYYQYVDDDENDLLFEEFMSLEESLKFRKNSDSWLENKVMPITRHSYGGAILIGYAKENCDKLYFEYEEGLEFIEENVYAFLKNLRFKYNDSYSPLNLYKRWGEDFWRVREDG